MNKITTAKKILALMAIAAPIALIAEPETAKSLPTTNAATEILWYGIYGIMAVLLAAIMILSNVLLNMVKITISKSATKVSAILLLLVVSHLAFAQNTPAATGTMPATASAGISWNMIMAMSIIITEIFVIMVLILRIRLLVVAITPQPEKKEEAVQIKIAHLLDTFNDSVAIENEKDILLDHDYDGIKELNNSLPGWWKYSFIISIFWAIGYFSYYTVMGGPSSHDEYDAAVQQAKERQEEYSRLNANKVDENTVTLADAGGVADGKDIFITNCKPCHGEHAEGGVGPNLTDDYWLHGGGIHNIFKSVKFGWPAKGMKSWQTDLSPVQIRNVASYIMSLHGSNPANAKAPQGDLFNAEVKTDSTANVSADTTKVKNL